MVNFVKAELGSCLAALGMYSEYFLNQPGISFILSA